VNRTVAAQLGGAIAFDWSLEGVVVTLRMSKDRLAYWAPRAAQHDQQSGRAS